MRGSTSGFRISPLIAAVAVATLAACSEGTAPEPPDEVSGTYTLTSRAGLPLPVQVALTTTTRTMLVSGTLEIRRVNPTDANDNANYTFSLTSQFERVVINSGAVTPLSESRIGFAWVTATNKLTYSTLLFDGSAFLTGSIGTGTLTYGTFEYRIN